MFSEDFPEHSLPISGIMRGTLVACEDGDMPIEAVQTGDIVNTLSDGPQVVRWVGQARSSALAVRFAAGALAENQPTHALTVAPAQRMALASWQSKVLFGESEVLVTAEALLNGGLVSKAPEGTDYTFFHILFDKHEVISANGAASESFYPTQSALNALPAEARAALFAQIPELRRLDANRPFALVHPIITANEAALLR